MSDAIPGDYEIFDPRFLKLIIPHAKLERLWTGGRWTALGMSDHSTLLAAGT